MTAGLLLAGACTTSAPIRSSLTYVSEDAYTPVLKQSSSRGELYQELDTRLLAEATLWTETFRQAYRKEYARAYRLSEDEEAALEAELARRAINGVELMVWVASADPKMASLKPEDELWKLRLYDDRGQTAVPLKVTEIRKPSEVDQHFFPFVDQPGKVYQVMFPVRPENGELFLSSKALMLQFVGVMGSLELRWAISDSEEGGLASAAR